jgi:hypothetical protein
MSTAAAAMCSQDGSTSQCDRNRVGCWAVVQFEIARSTCIDRP